MHIQLFPNMDFTICKPKKLRPEYLDTTFYFVAKTADGLSLLCLTANTPKDCLDREDGWKMFRVAGTLDFSLTGIMAQLSGLLAEANIPLFAVSTFDTDYIFVRAHDVATAVAAFAAGGHELSHAY